MCVEKFIWAFHSLPGWRQLTWKTLQFVNHVNYQTAWCHKEIHAVNKLTGFHERWGSKKKNTLSVTSACFFLLCWQTKTGTKHHEILPHSRNPGLRHTYFSSSLHQHLCYLKMGTSSINNQDKFLMGSFNKSLNYPAVQGVDDRRMKECKGARSHPLNINRRLNLGQQQKRKQEVHGGSSPALKQCRINKQGNVVVCRLSVLRSLTNSFRSDPGFSLQAFSIRTVSCSHLPPKTLSSSNISLTWHKSSSLLAHIRHWCSGFFKGLG